VRFRSFVVAAFGVALLAGLTACAPDPPYEPPPPAPVCYDGVGGYVDIRFVGPIDTKFNSERWTSTGGTCNGTLVAQDITVLVAPDATAAAAKCADLGGKFPGSLELLKPNYPAVPDNWWFC
jgi:hypothetical protein